MSDVLANPSDRVPDAAEPQKPAHRAGRHTPPSRSGRPRRKGVLPIKAVRTVAFGVISLSIFGCGGLCLLAVWDATTSGVSWRALASLGIVAGTMGAFAVTNELFGEAEARDA